MSNNNISQFSAKALKEKNKKCGIFHTPERLARYIAKYIPSDVTEVYDPTCGAGSLLKVFGDNVKKYGQEIEKDIAEFAMNDLCNADIACGDTLLEPAFLGKKFRGIVSNPPFSIDWEPEKLKDDTRFSIAPALAPKSKADYAFMLHTLSYLADDGVACFIMFPGILYRGNSEGKIRQWLVEQNVIERVEMLPNKLFDDTTINTCLIVCRKGKTTTDIVFADENGKENVATIDDVKKNNYCLSVNNYVEQEQTNKYVDFSPINNMIYIWKQCKKDIASNIMMSKLTDEFEGTEITECMLLEIKKLIDDELKNLKIKKTYKVIETTLF